MHNPATEVRIEEEKLLVAKPNKAIYSEAAMHACEEVMTRKFDFKEASFKEADAFLSPEMSEMKVLSEQGPPKQSKMPNPSRNLQGL